MRVAARGDDVRAADLRSTRSVRCMATTIDAALSTTRLARTFAKAARRAAMLVFLVRPPAIACMESTLLPFIDAAIENGREAHRLPLVRGRGDEQARPSSCRREASRRRAARAIRCCGRASSRRTSAARIATDIAEEGRLFLPAGRGRVAFVDIRDVAELAAIVFEDPLAHQGAAYDCTGPEAFSFEETARLMTDVIRRPIRYESASIAGLRAPSPCARPSARADRGADGAPRRPALRSEREDRSDARTSPRPSAAHARDVRARERPSMGARPKRTQQRDSRVEHVVDTMADRIDADDDKSEFFAWFRVSAGFYRGLTR